MQMRIKTNISFISTSMFIHSISSSQNHDCVFYFCVFKQHETSGYLKSQKYFINLFIKIFWNILIYK